jgi:hypothetical protein
MVCTRFIWFHKRHNISSIDSDAELLKDFCYSVELVSYCRVDINIIRAVIIPVSHHQHVSSANI